MTLSSACSKDAERILPRLALDHVERAVDDILGATDFLPACITEFMNFVMTAFPNFGSGWISRFSALWRRDIV
jgi:hypothetical protein